MLTLHEQPVRGKPLLTERDRAGKVLWHYEDMRDPASIQRLATGQIFVAERQSFEPRFWYQVVVVPGKKSSSQPEDLRELDTIVSISYLPDGRVLAGWIPRMLEEQGVGTLQTFDPRTQTLQLLSRAGSPHLVGRVQVEETAEGLLFSRVAMPRFLKDKEVFELAPDGARIWWLELPGSTHAARLRDGNTIACVHDRVVEFSMDKRLVAQAPGNGPLGAARPCLQMVRLGFPTREATSTLSLLSRRDPRSNQPARFPALCAGTSG